MPVENRESSPVRYETYDLYNTGDIRVAHLLPDTFGIKPGKVGCITLVHCIHPEDSDYGIAIIAGNDCELGHQALIGLACGAKIIDEEEHVYEDFSGCVVNMRNLSFKHHSESLNKMDERIFNLVLDVLEDNFY